MAAAKNWYLTATTGNSWRTVDEATQAAVSSTDGWIVSTTGDSTTSSYYVGVKRVATTFSGSTQPDGTLDTTNFDAFRTTNAYSGSFASANWTFTVVVRPTTLTGQTGAAVIRLFRSANANGSSATQITSAQQTGTTTAAMASTSTDYTSTVTFNPGAFSLTNEYLFFQLAWKRIAAGSMTGCDAVFRTGSSASVGSRSVSATFTAAHPTTGALVGPSTSLAGTATNFTVHATSGALSKSATLAGVAARATGAVTHATSGALAGSGKIVVGSANRTRVHATTGVLIGTGKVVAGTSRRFRAHATTSTLAGAGKVIAGTALNFTPHATTGMLIATGKVVAGIATNFSVHPSSGIIAATGKVIVGTAGRSTGAVTHAATGVLAGAGKIIAGTSRRFRSHANTGALTAAGKVIAGTALRAPGIVTHPATGALHGAAALSGTARHLARHAATGALPGHFAVLEASAQHAGAAHNALGSLIGGNAIVVSAARLADIYISTGILIGSVGLVAGNALRLPPMGVQPGGIARVQASGRGTQSSQPRPAAISVAQRSSAASSSQRSTVQPGGIRRT